MSELINYKLKDVADSQTGPFGSQLHERDYVEVGTPIVTVEHLGVESFTTQNLPFVSDEDRDRLSKYILKEGDIVFSRVGSIDRSTYVSSNEDGWMFSGRCIRVRSNGKVNPRYLAYYFRQDFFKKMMLNISVGATMPSLNTKLMDNIPLQLPSRENQDVIASILTKFENKIILNNKINAELEAMAKLIYDYWFVQFDFPDENGKPYKSSGGKMVYNEELKREIPEGWSSKFLNQLIEVGREQINPAAHPQKEFKHLSIPIFDKTSSYAIEKGEDIGSNKFTVGEHDVLVSKLNPWFNRIYYSRGEEDVICTTEMVVWKCFETSMKNFYFQLAGSKHFIAYCTQSATGTSNSHKRVSPTIMMQYKIPYKKDVIEKYGISINPWIEKMNKIQLENQTLSSLRDWLLPMLMNGQVKVGE